MLKKFNDSYFITKQMTSPGCIFFMQRWTELTYDKTIDSYQYSVMNTTIALKECFDITCKILDGTYPTMDNLTDSKSELSRLLKDDWVIKKYNLGLYNSLLFTANKKIDPKTKISNLKQLKSKIIYQLDLLTQSFNEWIISELTTSIEKTELSKIDYLSNVLVSQCVNLGWSERGLFNMHKYFLNKTESDLITLEKFIHILFREKDNYMVYIKMTKKERLEDLKEWTEKFNIKLEKGQTILDRYTSEMHSYMALDPGGFYLALPTKATDPAAAALNVTDKCKKMMELLTFYNKFGPWSPDDTTFCTVKNENFVDVLKSKQLYGTFLYIESSNSIFEDTLAIFTTEDPKYKLIQDKLQSVYSYINISKLAKYKEEEFLNMWIGIESFMNTGNYGNIIAHIKQILPSVMCKRYIYRSVRNLCEDFQRCYVKLTLSTGEIDLKQYDKRELVEKLIFALKTDVLYDEIIDLSDINKLLKYRIENIKKIIIDEEVMYKKIVRYSDTVLWHIQRLYRLRNDITHSGYLSENDITPYIEHLHNFTAALIIEVVYIIADDDNNLFNIGDILAYLQDTFISYKEKYSVTNSVFTTGIIELE